MVVTALLLFVCTTAAAQQGSGQRFATGEASLKRANLPDGEPAEEGETVDRVRVSGNRRVERQTLLDRVRTEKGAPLDPALVSRDIHRVYDLGYFSDVKVDATTTPDGRTVVTFVVREKPAIAEIRFEGNNEFDDEKLQKKVSVQANTILDVARVKKNVETIRQQYIDKGYYLAEVDYRIVQVDKRTNRVAVVYDIREFRKVEVKRITLLGNEEIPDSRLKRIMKTRAGSVMSLISKTGKFAEKDFQQDLKRLTAYYYDQGFVEVNVGSPTIRLSEDKQFIYITLRIDEGQRYSVGSISLKGEMLGERKKLREMIELKSGDVFSYGQMRRDAREVKNFFADQGYAYAQTKPLTRLNREKQTVDVGLRIQPGKKVYFRRITIQGNQKTRDKVIRRELEIEPGELYSNTAIERSKKRIKRLGYFKKVEITTQKTEKPDVIDATVQVNERRTGNFQVGAGFSNAESFIFNAQIAQNNLFGQGQSLSLQARISGIRQMFNLRFVEPWLFDTRWQFSVRAFNFEFQYSDFTRASTGGNISFGYPISALFDAEIPGELVAKGTYTLEDIQIEAGGQSNTSQRPGQFRSGAITSSLRGQLRYDSRDNRLFPSGGQLHKMSVEYADSAVTFSEAEFLKFKIDSRVYIPLVWELVLRLNGELGYITSLEEGEPVPLSERYLVGGPRTLRGFDYYTVGPTQSVARSGNDPASSLSDFNIGGNKQLLLTAEIEFPILTAAGLKGVVFADAGNAFGSSQPLTLALDIFSDPEQDYRDVLRTAVGFGVRWRSPLGPLRFEWGFPLEPLRGERSRVFHFTIGRAF